MGGTENRGLLAESLTDPVRPSAEDQVRFLLNVQRLLGEGSFVATYKFALLHALADLALSEGDDTATEMVLETSKIAERMVELYWPQAAEHVGGAHIHSLAAAGSGAQTIRQILQNSGRQAEIIGHITRASDAGSLGRVRRDARVWKRLVADVDVTLRKMPLWKLQTIGGDAVEFLYANDPAKSARTIQLRSGVAYCLRAYHGLVTELARGAWLRFVRRQNPGLEQGAVDLASFLFGRERGSLDVFRAPLREVQSGGCFYCHRPLAADAGHVDHFIPWARYAADIPHNFVLAHGSCNGRKSDFLASEAHLERWVVRNDVHADVFADVAGRELFERSSSRAAGVARWAYGQTEASRLRVWLGGKDFEHLSGAWRQLLSAS